MSERPAVVPRRGAPWLVLFALAAVAAGGGWLLASPPAPASGPTRSSRVAWSEARKETGDWGEFRAHFEGQTHGLKDMLTGMAELKPGQEIHPPHRHAEEEFLALTEGSGTWTLDGRDFPAAKGDVIYAAPWVVHGIKNTATVPLRFVVVKWNTKGVAPPPEPKAP